MLLGMARGSEMALEMEMAPGMAQGLEMALERPRGSEMETAKMRSIPSQKFVGNRVALSVPSGEEDNHTHNILNQKF